MSEETLEPDKISPTFGELLSLLEDVIHVAFLSAAESWAHLGLTLRELKVLLLVASRLGTSASSLARRMRLARPNMTGLLDRLEAKNLVKRVPHPEDRRLILIELTAGGDQLLRGLADGSRWLLAEALNSLRRREQQALLEGLRPFSDALSRARRSLLGVEGPPPGAG